MRVITWDTEIMEEVENMPNGWEDARRGECGISCAALYDSSTQRVHVYAARPYEPGCLGLDAWADEDIIALVDHLNSADLLIGFNSIAFDTPALQGFTGCDIGVQQYDILHEIWGALGGKRYKGFGLDPLCQRLELGSKNGQSGESAPRLYKDGRMGRLLDYCINDVVLTRRLAKHIQRTGTITTPEGDEVIVRSTDARI